MEVLGTSVEMPRVGLLCNRDHRLHRGRRRRMLKRIFRQLFRTGRGLLLTIKMTVRLFNWLARDCPKYRKKTPCTKPFYVHLRVSTNLVIDLITYNFKIETVCHNNWTVYSYVSITEATDKVEKGFTSLHLCQMAYIYAETRPHYYSGRSP